MPPTPLAFRASAAFSVCSSDSKEKERKVAMSPLSSSIRRNFRRGNSACKGILDVFFHLLLAGDDGVQFAKLRQPDGRGQFVHAVVHTQEGVVFRSAVVADVVVPVVDVTVYFYGQVVIVGHDGPAFAHGDHFGEVVKRSIPIAKRAELLSFIVAPIA